MKTIVIPPTNRRAIEFLDKLKSTKAIAMEKAHTRLAKKVASLKNEVLVIKSNG